MILPVKGYSDGQKTNAAMISTLEDGTMPQNSQGLEPDAKVSLLDPTWKILPAALKKYKVVDEDWRHYAMFICYGATQRCINLDERPLMIFRKLKDENKKPSCKLIHIQNLLTPVRAALKHSSRTETTLFQSEPTVMRESSRPSYNSKVSEVGQKDKIPSGASADVGVCAGNIDHDTTIPGISTHEVAESAASFLIEDVSYAVAIYPSEAECDDEFDVMVGDSFIILFREQETLVVKRDPDGGRAHQSGFSIGERGRVPASCLLEISVPLAKAASDTVNAIVSADNIILPRYILSPSTPGFAIMDYKRRGIEELDLAKDDILRVVKRVNHWLYVVKESGENGWVPVNT